MERTVVEAVPVGMAPGDGFDGFVAARGDALWRSAWLLTGDHQLAEDLVQTALAKSWRAWHGEEPVLTGAGRAALLSPPATRGDRR